MTSLPSARPRASGAGRPRDESKTPQILTAVLALIATTGYQALRVEDVAARAGVSPGSVYRRWPSKQDLVVAAIDSSAPPFPLDGTGDADLDFVTMMADMAMALSEPGHTRLALLASDPDEPEISAAARRLIPRVQRYVRMLIAHRIGPGHPALEMLADLGPALIWYRSLIAGEQIDAPELVSELTTHVLDRVGYVPARSATTTAAGPIPAGPAGDPDGDSNSDRGRSPRSDQARNRRNIIAAAGELFADRTFDEVALEDVAARAGVSRATLVRHVGTKRQLLVEVRMQRARDLLGLAERAQAEPDPRRGVELLVRTTAGWAVDDPGLADVLDRAWSDSDEWRVLVDQLSAAVDAVLDRARDAGLLRPDVTGHDVLRLVFSVVGAAGGGRSDGLRYADVLLAGLTAG